MKAGVTVYFIRHGQTGWNKERRIQGQIDSDLNDTGREQAARNGTILREQVADLGTLDFVASPLKRTFETMQIVRENAGLPRDDFRTDDLLKEIHFGVWQGEYWPKVPDVDPEGFKVRQADPFNWRPEGGESYGDLTSRAATWLSGVERDTVCVSHGGVSRVLRGHLLGVDPVEVTELSVPQDKILVLRRNDDGEAAMEWV